MFNLFDFPNSSPMRRSAMKAAQVIARAKLRLKKQGTPVIYLNDHCGLWNADWKTVYQLCTQKRAKGKEIAEALKPEESDYVLLKPKHSGFYATPFEELLIELKVKSLILTGVTGSICVYFTAYDGHMRSYKLWVPSDATASNTPSENQKALWLLKETLGVSIRRLQRSP